MKIKWNIDKEKVQGSFWYLNIKYLMDCAIILQK